MEGVTIREATEEDYDDILAIRTVYGGRDYLKDSFKYIIERNKGYVAVLDQQIIGFKFACIIDNGMTLLTRAARVREEYEGKGVNKMLDQHIRDIYGKHVKYEAVSFNNNNPNLVKKVKDGSQSVTLYRENQVFRATTQELRQKESSIKASNSVKLLSPGDVEYIFSSDELRPHLFPAKILSSNWIPLKIMKENVVHIFGENGVVLGSNVTEGEDQSKALLSFGHPFTCAVGQIYHVDMYGHGVDHVVGHMSFFYNEVTNATNEEVIIFEVYADPPLQSSVEEAMMKLGLRQHVWNVISAMYCIEYDLRK